MGLAIASTPVSLVAPTILFEMFWKFWDGDQEQHLPPIVQPSPPVSEAELNRLPGQDKSRPALSGDDMV
jgi:hypothetical protein